MFMIITATVSSAAAQTCDGISDTECHALYTLYNSTDGDYWTTNTNWLTTEPVSSWYGITIAGGLVQKIDLRSNNLTGTIPSELSNLAGLEDLYLHSNNLYGDLPEFLATRYRVDLSWNCLHASNPAVLAAMETKHGGGFMSTQTVPPDNVAAKTVESGGTDENRILVSWDPISYADNEGGYKVYFRQAGEPGYHRYGMTADKETSSLTVSNLEPGVEYEFLVNSVTWAHADNKNDLFSPDSDTDSAVTGTYSRIFLPNWKRASGYWTGVVVSNFGDTGFNLNLAAYSPEGVLEQLAQNPAGTVVGAGRQKSLLGSEFFGSGGSGLSWIEIAAENSSHMGSMFLFGVNDTQLMDGAESQSSYARKLYFTRPLDEGFFAGWGPEIQMSIVNPTDEEVTVLCVLKGSNGTAENTHAIPSRGFISGGADDLVGAGHGILNGYLEIEVTEGAGVIGFSRVEFPGVRTGLGMNAVESTQARKLYSAQLANGMNIVTSLRLVNTSKSTRSVTLSAFGDKESYRAHPVQVQIAGESIYSADLGTIFQLEFEGLITTGTLVVDTDGGGVIGDIILAEGDTMEYAMSLPLQDRLFQEAVFNHISNLSTVFTGFAFYNPGELTADVLIEAIGTNGQKVKEKTLILDPGERIARILDDPDIWPDFGEQSGGYIKIRSTQPIAGQQLFGDRSLRYMAAIPPTTRVEAMFD